MWWAYVELGWGGYWAWDPVENASLLPWLTMTAFLHSVMIQEKRGMLKRWNMRLIIGSFLLSIFGTFITRSGVIASVHSFTQSNVGYFFLGVPAWSPAILSFTLLYTRWPQLRGGGRSSSRWLSREAAFLFNNLVFVGIAFSVLWGTLFPILSEAVRGTKITVGPPFFNKVNVPLGLLLLAPDRHRAADRLAQGLHRQSQAPVHLRRVATGAGDRCCVLLALGHAGPLRPDGARLWPGSWPGPWSRSSPVASGRATGCTASRCPCAFARLVARNRRRYGGYIVHVGMVIYFVAFTGMAFKVEQEATLKPGESVELTSPFGHAYRLHPSGRLAVRGAQPGGHRGHRRGDQGRQARSGVMTSEKRQHVDSFGRPTFEPSTEVAIRSNLAGGPLHRLRRRRWTGTEEAVYRFTINPLVWWVWIGGVVLVIGGLITMWPGSGPTGAPRPAPAGYQVQLVGAAAGKGQDRGA